jgi:hypothetical protein
MMTEGATREGRLLYASREAEWELSQRDSERRTKLSLKLKATLGTETRKESQPCPRSRAS